LTDIFTEVFKRDGRIVPFDKTKISEAIQRAAQQVKEEDNIDINKVTEDVVSYLNEVKRDSVPSVEEIQDAVERTLMENGYSKIAKAYILYRDKRTRIRDTKSDLMDAVSEILVEANKENANVSNSPSAKMLQIASAASKAYYLSRLIPEDIAQAHTDGDIHIHDIDFYSKTLTCLQIPLRRLLHEGFDNGHGYIRPPKRISSASALACIILQSCQNDMHGGQSYPFFDRDMADFVGNADENEIYQAMEAMIYNLNSMHSRGGGQVPFSSINIGTDTSQNGRAVTKAILLAHEAGLGRGEIPLWPNIIFRLKKGINFNPGDPNYDLFKLAMKVSSKNLNPTFSFMDSSFNSQYGTEVSTMGCRTRVIADRHGNPISEGRGNLSFTTINLPRIAIKSEGDAGKFYNILDSVLELAARQLYHRYIVQSRLKVKDMPFLMGQKLYVDSERLESDDIIEEAIKHGTLSIGFIGLAETLIVLCGRHHGESNDVQQVGIDIVSYMRKKVDEFANHYDLNYTLLATPAEGLSGRFVAKDKNIFGVIPGVTDKEYYTNSFHIPVSYPIDSYNKVRIEGAYHKYTNAGHISYVELSSPPIYNLTAYESLLRHMADSDMGYAGINFPVDVCKSCGYKGIYPNECPVCGSYDISRVRRITGYLSTVDRFNDAKLAELKDRTPHM
jgi:anaerobic ribonucleoside-triphosphate reductase